MKIVYDNESKPKFESGWGFSCLINLKNEKILFDTGWDGKVLLSTLEKFNVRSEEIDKVVLSHAHWDHIGGLTHIQHPNISVYVPTSFSEHLKEEIEARFTLREVEDAQKIRDKVWSTGELKNDIEEQSLIIDSESGLVVITGCSHPGVGKILSTAKKFGEIYGIVGGLHDFDDYKVLKNLNLIAPMHCTKNKDKIKEIYPGSFVEGKAGTKIKLE